MREMTPPYITNGFVGIIRMSARVCVREQREKNMWLYVTSISLFVR